MTPVCQKCHGEGKIETTTPNNVKYRTYDPCPDCKGSEYDTEWITCPECNGSGNRNDPYDYYDVDIPERCDRCNGHGQIRKVQS